MLVEGMPVLHQKRFEELVMAELPFLRSKARKFYQNVHDAEDLVQQVYIRAVEHQSQERMSATKLRGWLYTMMRRMFINQYRRSKRIVEQEEKLYKHMSEVVEYTTDSLAMSHINEAINKLPEEFQPTIRKYFLEQKSYKTIAEEVGCPIGTVMSRIFRGRNMLKEQLKDLAIERGILHEN
jgi:RNA polymerase sigma-70 factor (ECF subfamily)